MISFLLSGPGRWLAGALVAVLVVAGAYIKGRSDGAAITAAQI